MTTRPDPDPVISAWLNDEAAERAPEHLLSTTRTRIESTNQRRAWWPAWRLQPMNNRVLGGAVAVIAVIVVLGFVLIPRPTGSGGVTPTPVPTPVPSASPNPSPSPAPSSTPAPSPAVIPPGVICSATLCLTGTLEAGAYSFTGGSIAGGAVTPTDVTFAVPAGWTTDSGYVSKNALTIQNDLAHIGPHEVFFATFPITNVFSDACHWTNTMVSAGTTVDSLTNLLVAQKGGRVASAPTNVTLGGFPAKRIRFTVPAAVGVESCDAGVGLLHFWPNPDGTSNGGICCSAVGSTDVVYVVNDGGQLLIVLTRQAAGATPADLTELNAIVASVKIAKPPASPPPSGASPSP
jgi:hypothetical protein